MMKGKSRLRISRKKMNAKERTRAMEKAKNGYNYNRQAYDGHQDQGEEVNDGP